MFSNILQERVSFKRLLDSLKINYCISVQIGMKCSNEIGLERFIINYLSFTYIKKII